MSTIETEHHIDHHTQTSIFLKLKKKRKLTIRTKICESWKLQRMIRCENMQNFIIQILSHQFTSSSRARIVLEPLFSFETSFSKRKVLKLLSGTLFILSTFQKKVTIGHIRLSLLSLFRSNLVLLLQAKTPLLEQALEKRMLRMAKSRV